ncbi:hypothetical protein EYF80_022646 [Liparis tanakae]|uniref:Uncharacterized protein n=1 Tax=Liparis tanakae TaxID=230148 RepID=A0A4Z2HMP0_9TELE|nr:hypothetical protein EYF80_022646 [Liparis tanakae]
MSADLGFEVTCKPIEKPSIKKKNNNKTTISCWRRAEQEKAPCGAGLVRVRRDVSKLGVVMFPELNTARGFKENENTSVMEVMVIVQHYGKNTRPIPSSVEESVSAGRERRQTSDQDESPNSSGHRCQTQGRRAEFGPATLFHREGVSFTLQAPAKIPKKTSKLRVARLELRMQNAATYQICCAL